MKQIRVLNYLAFAMLMVTTFLGYQSLWGLLFHPAISVAVTGWGAGGRRGRSQGATNTSRPAKAAARRVRASVSCQTQAGRGEIHARAAASVMYCADMCNRVLDNAVQVHGGTGYMWETEINRLFRGTKLLEIGAGTTEVRKMIIAGELLR